MNVATCLLAGGAGTRLRPLTLKRCKPSVPFGGNLRVIDFTLMNCAASGLRQVYVLTRHEPDVLILHFRERWSRLAHELRITPLEPGVRSSYAGTADAVYSNLGPLGIQRPDVVLVLSGDHVYRADYRAVLEEHLGRDADVTVLTDRIPAEEASQFGVLEVSSTGRVTRFVEKPPQPLRYSRSGTCSVNLGVYCFRPEFLVEQLLADAADQSSTRDFGRDILPQSLGMGVVASCPLEAVSVDREPYWRDVGTVESFFEASLDLVRPEPRFSLRDKRWSSDAPFRKWRSPLNRRGNLGLTRLVEPPRASGVASH